MLSTTVFSIPLELLCDVFGLLAEEAREKWIKHLKLKEVTSLVSWSAYESHAPGETSRSGYMRWRMDYVPPPPLPYAWMRITHVCRAWRIAALSDPRLWTHIAIVRREAVETMVYRTAGLPLTVSFRTGSNEERAETFRQLLHTHPRQIGTLVMPFIAKYLTASLAVSMPCLRTLLFVEFMPSDQTICPAEASSMFTALERLESVAALRFPITCLCTSALKSLVLVHGFPGARFESQYLPTIEKLTHSLARSPHLEYLEVILSNTMPHPQAAVALPRLRTLRLTALTKVCAAALRSFRIPQTAKLVLKCLSPLDFPIERDWSVISAAVSQIVTTPPNVRSLQFAPVVCIDAAIFPSMYKLRGWRTARSLLGSEEADRIPADVELTIDVPSHVEDIVEVLAPLTLPDVQIYRQGFLFTHDVGRASFDFAYALCTMPQLRHLTINCAQAALQCELLHATSAQSVALVATNLQDKNELKTEEWMKHCLYYTGTFQDVVDICRKRGRDGRPLRELVLCDANSVAHDGVAELEEVVQYVVCTSCSY